MGVLSRSDAQQARKAQPGLPPIREAAEAAEAAAAQVCDSEALLVDAAAVAGKPGWGLTWRQPLFLAAALGLATTVHLACSVALRPGGPARGGRGQQHPDTEVGPPPQAPGASGACDAAQLEESRCPLRSLFADPDVLAASAANVMKVGAGLLNANDEGFVKDVMAQVFREVSSILQSRAAPVALALDSIDLNAEEKGAALVHLALLSDAEVRGIGVEVAKAMRDLHALSPSAEPGEFRSHIQERLVPRLRELDTFSEKVVPGRLVTLWGHGREWTMTLDPVNMQSMDSVVGKFVNGIQPAGRIEMKQKVEAVRGAALEMARSLLDFLLLCVSDMGPGWSTDVGDTMAVAGDGPLSRPCELALGGTSNDFDKGLICPLKLGAQGLDAMRAVRAP